MKVHAAARHIDSGYGRRASVNIKARRVYPFSKIVVEVELHGNTMSDPVTSIGSERTIPKTSTARALGSGAGVLYRKGQAIGPGIGQLEAEFLGETLDIDLVYVPRAGPLTGSPVREP